MTAKPASENVVDPMIRPLDQGLRVCVCVCVRARAHTHTHTHTHACTHAHTHVRTHSHSHTRAHSRTHRHTQTHTRARAYAHTYTHTHTHTHTPRTHTHTHARTHTHTHLSYLSRSLADCWGTTVDFTISFLHSSQFSAFRSMIFHSRPVHSLMLSSHRFLFVSLLALFPVG